MFFSLTIRASCIMNLRNLPLDTQHCTLLIGSFAYDSNETVYEWNTQRAVDIQRDLIMNQFSLIDAQVGQEILIRNNRKCYDKFDFISKDFFISKELVRSYTLYFPFVVTSVIFSFNYMSHVS